jgi:hypothetical protein
VRYQRRRRHRRSAQCRGAAYRQKAEPGTPVPNSWLTRSVYPHGIPPRMRSRRRAHLITDTFLRRRAGSSAPC